MAGEQTQFQAMVLNLMSSDNAIRVQAEETYESVPAINKVPFLLQTMIDVTCQLEVRSMAAVLLRRLYTSNFEEFWPVFPVEVQNQLKVQMILSIQQEKNTAIRKKICECVAEFARNLLDEDGTNHWPEFLKFIFECTQDINLDMKESALIVFGIVPGLFGSQQNQHLDTIKQMLHQCIIDQAHPNVRILAAKAAVAFVLTNEHETSVLNHFKDLLPFILECVKESLNQAEDDSLLKCIIDLADSVPKFLKHQLEMVFNLCYEIISNKEILSSWRQLALEVIVTLSESSPALLRKQLNFIEKLVYQVLEMMVDLEEDPEWSVADEIDESDTESNSIAGESALDRLACGLGGKTMLPFITRNIPKMLEKEDWKFRHAGLMAISACGEGCHTQMEEVLHSIVDAVLPFLKDPHPRVRYAACNALGQMATDFGPIFQKKFHQKVVPGLLLVIENNYNFPRVQAHAGAALVNFSEDCPKNILTMYLEPIMNQLEQVLNAKFKELVEKGTKLVLEQIVTTLASVADTAEEKFEFYYDKFMPCLKYIFQNATSPELRMLRGKTIECISLVGLAVGREKFMQDCSEMMELLLKTQTEWQELPEDDPQISYMISAWARICKIMGRDFEQYLPLVMGPVLKAASLKPEVAVLDSDDMKVLENDSEWQFVTLGDQQSFGIRTAGLEEKATACLMLVCYARELKEGFAEYAEEVVKIMVSHLKFYFHDGVRLAAAESLPSLLECAQIKGPEYLNNMWQYICPELLKAIKDDPELNVKAEHMGSLAQCIELMGPSCFTDEQLNELKQLLENILVQHFERQATKQQQQQNDEDYDEEHNSEEDLYYMSIMSKVSDIMHSLLGKYKETILPFFDQLLPNFVKLLAPDSPWSDKQWGICIFDDVLEYIGPNSFIYQQYFLQPLIQSLTDKRPEVRQASAYGIGVMAKFGASVYFQACTEALPFLIKMIQEPNSRTPENCNATENAISAIAKICKFSPISVNLAEVLPLWMSWLPVFEDDEEAVHVFSYLCDLIESNNQFILGENNQNLPQLLKLLTEAFHLNAILPQSEVGIRIISILKQLQGNEQIFQACVIQLSQELQESLIHVLN